ncbi:MAG: InlB B-repeat-containing protein [Bacilli bacterium]
MDNLIKVPKEYARILDRMGGEFKIIQEDADGFAIKAPIEFCRVLARMGREFQKFTDSDFIFEKSTEYTDTSITPEILEKFLANQSNIKTVTQVGNACTIHVDLDKLNTLTSPATGLTKKYVCMLIHTNFKSIIGMKWEGTPLTQADVDEATNLGGEAGDIAWWVAAEDAIGTTISRTIAYEDHTTEDISITAVDVSKYNISYINEDETVTVRFTDGAGNTITPGTDVISKGATVNVILTAIQGKCIDAVTIGDDTTNVGLESDTIQITSNANANIAVTATSVDARTLTYDSNAPQGTTATGTMSSVVLGSGYSTSVATNAFLIEGYTFSKWNTLADGTGTDYNPEETITVTADTTLYAQWTQN